MPPTVPQSALYYSSSMQRWRSVLLLGTDLLPAAAERASWIRQTLTDVYLEQPHAGYAVTCPCIMIESPLCVPADLHQPPSRATRSESCRR